MTILFEMEGKLITILFWNERKNDGQHLFPFNIPQTI